jgi:hypothetical protein
MFAAAARNISDESSGVEDGSGLTSRRGQKKQAGQTPPAMAGMVHMHAVRFLGGTRDGEGKRHIGGSGVPSSSSSMVSWHMFFH